MNIYIKYPFLHFSPLFGLIISPSEFSKQTAAIFCHKNGLLPFFATIITNRRQTDLYKFQGRPFFLYKFTSLIFCWFAYCPNYLATDRLVQVSDTSPFLSQAIDCVCVVDCPLAEYKLVQVSDTSPFLVQAI